MTPSTLLFIGAVAYLLNGGEKKKNYKKHDSHKSYHSSSSSHHSDNSYHTSSSHRSHRNSSYDDALAWQNDHSDLGI